VLRCVVNFVLLIEPLIEFMCGSCVGDELDIRSDIAVW